ncbi:MAG TPA: macro domain-containing protein [Bryobacteraceae bacterium]|jgi:O-acetyl-ADP-ribose deacetylase (regulator of RNase III)|nr:macro domain-containing protein [Bryobacteraceae bacterium]
MRNRSYQFGKSRLTIEFGDITSANAQVIVSSDDYYITMGGGVSASILRAGGQEIMIDAAKKVPAKLGEIIVTTAGRLQAQYVFHAITIEGRRTDRGKAQAKDIVRNSVSRCFDLLDSLGLNSIAFPAIGAGVAGFSYEDVAIEMADVVAGRLAQTNRAIEVTIFLFDRFGQMQPIDFIKFFEEFARRVPEVAAHELGGPIVSAARPLSPPTRKRADPVPHQQELRLKLNELTEERTSLEEQLARAAEQQTDETGRSRKRLAEIADERIRILAELQRAQAEPVAVFISYSHKDQVLREELEKQLTILKRQGVIKIWHDRKITAGSEWRGAIDENLTSANLVLLLISPDFIASDYCYDVEMECAMRRHESREARVIPVILRQFMWDKAPFAKLQALPTDGKAVMGWDDRDDALYNIASGIRATVESMLAARSKGA